MPQLVTLHEAKSLAVGAQQGPRPFFLFGSSPSGSSQQGKNYRLVDMHALQILEW